MANRRFGMQGPPQRGNASGRGFGQASSISPWQGGAPPGAASNQSLQTQLALALTNLIQQTQAQSAAHDGPPSLLNLNTSPGFFKQDHYTNPSPARFPGNRGRHDFRRYEPFAKNRASGWRSDSRHRAANSCSPQSNLNSSRDSKGQRNASRDSSKKVAIDKSLSKQDKPADTANANGSSASNAPTEPPPAPAPPPPPLVRASPARKVESVEPKTLSLYEGIPNGLLHCCVCNKSMWDGESFQNHLGGKAHKQMVQSLEESFQITVNILRENMRLSEERKLIEYERVKRSRRFFHAPSEPESMCNMCDLKFMGKIVLHRQSEGHQRLKRFLHPKCTKCHVEFTARMEWVDHLFMPEHLLKVKEHMDAHAAEYGEYKRIVKVDIDNDPLLEENMQNEDDHPVLELTDDLTNLFNRIPVYKHDRSVSTASLKPAVGSLCDLCRVFMGSEEEAQDHLKSYKHYVKFVETVKAKYQRIANEKKSEPEPVEMKAATVAKEKSAQEGKGESSEKASGECAEEEDDNMYDETMNKMLDDIYCEAKEEANEIGSTTEDCDMRVTRNAKLRNGTGPEPAAKKTRL